jgi:hypothetical protein
MVNHYALKSIHVKLKLTHDGRQMPGRCRGIRFSGISNEELAARMSCLGRAPARIVKVCGCRGSLCCVRFREWQNTADPLAVSLPLNLLCIDGTRVAGPLSLPLTQPNLAAFQEFAKDSNLRRTGPYCWGFGGEDAGCCGRGRLAGGTMPFMRRYSTIWP